MPDVLDASATRRWCTASLDALTAARRRIDDLNVFPVADGDTGTNLGQTLGAASAQLRATESSDAAALLAALAEGAARGARGNSGVILAQLLGGLAGGARIGEPIGAEALARGLTAGAVAARAALAEPVEGTILSVASAAAAAATAAAARQPTGPDSLVAVARAAAEGAADALARTPQQLDVLGKAGVVDAGGLGLVLILDALVGVLAGDIVLRPEALTGPEQLDRLATADADRVRPRETGSEEFGYEVQYLLDADEAALRALRGVLGRLGDSLAIVGVGDGTWNVHVHVNDVGAAIEAGLSAGRTSRIAVTRFADQIADRRAGRLESGAPRVAVVAVVAAEPGAGLGHLFAGEGVAVVESVGGPDLDAALRELRIELVKAVLGTRASGVVVLTAAAAAAPAEAAAVEARAQGRQVAVIALRSVVQGLAALAVHDPAREFAENVAAMAEAAGATRCAEVIVAPAAIRTARGWCAAGDAVGLIEGEPAAFGAEPAAVAAELLMRILSVGGELVTVLPGAGVTAAQLDALRATLREHAPDVELSVLPGGQAAPPLLLGIE